MENKNEFLATEPVVSLIAKFAIPSILSLLVMSAYNITDQIFIGNVVGVLGNAATNVSFPIVTLSGAISVLIGIGTSSNFNISMGAKKYEDAKEYIGTGLSLLLGVGILMLIFVLLFKDTLLKLFGATENVLPYASIYLGITAFGLPFTIFTGAASAIIRADGSPTYSMICNVIGAILNVFLDYLFMFPLKLGIAGAAIATVSGQIISFILSIAYFFKFKSFKLDLSMIKPKLSYAINIVKLGAPNCINLVLIMVVNIILNNTLKYYGSKSIYGGDIPLAVAGVVSKVASILIAISVGLAQGCQPVLGFNIGAKNYKRVRETYIKAVIASLSISLIFFIIFQFYPHLVINVFGRGDELYTNFAEKYIRIYMFFIFSYAIEPLTVNYFSSTGNSRAGVILSLTRQAFGLIPMLIILPMIFGINGVLFAGPVSDIISTTISTIMIVINLRQLKKLESAK